MPVKPTEQMASRRGFLIGATGLAVYAAGGAGSAAPVAAADLGALEKAIQGTAVTRGDALYEPWRQSMIWQTQKFRRYPDVIVQAESVEDVRAAVDFARTHKMQLTTRAGGHSFCGCFLRDGGMLVDVSRLQTVQIDTSAKEAMVGPGVIGRRLNAELGAVGLAFPTAHCGMVPISGFLLGGGLGWNGNAWGGMSTFNIAELEIVTADGQVRRASAHENPDLFWAARGGGPGLFGVVTRFRLKCHDLPKAIRSHSFIFPFTSLATVYAAAERIGPKLPTNVELIAVTTAAPPEFVGKCAAAGCDQICILQGVAFAGSDSDAVAALRPLAEDAITESALARTLNEAVSFERLYHDNELPFPQRRYAVDNIYADQLDQIATILGDRLPNSPSRLTVPVLLYKGAPKFPDAACSTTGKFYVSCYAQWDRPEDDAANKKWLIDLYEQLQPLGTGSYINELNQEGRTHRIAECYAPAAWTRLSETRRKWDPDGVFRGFYGISV